MADALPQTVTVMGLAIDIVGAFFLAAESIGIPRIQSAANSIIHALRRVFGSTPLMTTLTIAYLVALASVTRTRVVQMAGGIPAEYPFPLSTLGFGFVMIYLILGFVFLLFVLRRLLMYVSTSVETHRAGVLGFMLLFVGFILQLAGTLRL